MIFISSLLPLTELGNKSTNQITNMDWFLFSALIKNKNYRHDDELDMMKDKLTLYPIFYTDQLYNYLMTDNYYYKTDLYNTMRNSFKYISMKKVKLHEGIIDFKKETINQEERIFGEYDIKIMFDCFRENNFRKNPVCEYVLG